jgi:hypothetical protein
VIGHFDDPIAETCRYTEDYSDLDVSPKDAVESCRTTFVVTRINR